VTARLVRKTCPTVGCGTVSLGHPKRVFCDKCAVSRAAARKALEPLDLTEAEVDRVYREALAQIKRERRYSGDETWQMDWKYQ
jgi:ribosomal protein S27AE